jgi:hypothetical protein
VDGYGSEFKPWSAEGSKSGGEGHGVVDAFQTMAGYLSFAAEDKC